MELKSLLKVIDPKRKLTAPKLSRHQAASHSNYCLGSLMPILLCPNWPLVQKNGSWVYETGDRLKTQMWKDFNHFFFYSCVWAEYKFTCLTSPFVVHTRQILIKCFGGTYISKGFQLSCRSWLDIGELEYSSRDVNNDTNTDWFWNSDNPVPGFPVFIPVDYIPFSNWTGLSAQHGKPWPCF